MNTSLDTFETRLLDSLRTEVADRATDQENPDPSPTNARRPRRRYLLTAAAVAATAGALLFVPGLGTQPAYSVQDGNAGEVIVEINRPEDAAGLQSALAAHGIAADITYLPELQECAQGRFTEVDRAIPGLTVSVGTESVGVIIPPGTVRDGETFVLTWSVLPMTDKELESLDAVSGGHLSTDFGVAAGPVAPCKPVPAQS
ncbi:MAG: hypothetical protein Q4G67_10335 [Actinomycetia bacterium]|nr:hypothetical protein [Actinomycetes bacterium]